MPPSSAEADPAGAVEGGPGLAPTTAEAVVGSDPISAGLLSETGTALPRGRRRPRVFRGVTGFIVRRTLLGVLTLFIASIIIFAATQALPGDPARAILGRTATPESLAALREQLDLDRPVTEQYWDWLSGVLTGDLGESLVAGQPVTELLGSRIVNSAFLMLLAALVSVPLAILIGVVSARRRDGPLDHTLSVTTLAVAGLPEFVVGIALVVLFGTTVFTVLPPVSLIPPDSAPWNYPKELILPTLTLVIAVSPYIARIMRASMIEVLESDYVEMARLKGLPRAEGRLGTRPPQRDRPDDSGHRHQPRLPGRRHRRRRVRVRLSGDRRGARRRGREPRHSGRPGSRTAHRGRLRRSQSHRRRRHDPGQPPRADDASMTTVAAPGPAVPLPKQRRPWVVLLAAAWRQGRTKIGLALVLLLVGCALIGPLFAPYSPTEFVGAPYEKPSADALLGTDNLGRDVLSRFLWGGRSILALAVLSTVLGVVLGVAVGLVAAYARNALDDALMRAMDVILAFPQIVLALVAVATVGPKLWLLVLVVGFTTAPRVARVVRGAALDVVERDFVRAAEGIGVSRTKILFGEVLPNVTSPLVVETSLRLTFSIALISALSFLGFGLQPPAADWGLMINENRLGLEIQPWGVVMPVIAIGLLTIGTSLVGDGFSRASIGIERGGRAE